LMLGTKNQDDSDFTVVEIKSQTQKQKKTLYLGLFIFGSFIVLFQCRICHYHHKL